MLFNSASQGYVCWPEKQVSARRKTGWSSSGWLHCDIWVRVKTAHEIELTLDSEGKTEGLPFMPEMVPFCGHTFRVRSLADKTCVRGFRRLDRVCHLENTRCSGRAHGGCQACCLLYWHEAWLEPAAGPIASSDEHLNIPIQISQASDSNTQTYRCQLTEVGKLGTETPVPGVLHYFRLFWSGKLGRSKLKFLARWTSDRILLAFHRRLKHSSQPVREHEQFMVGDRVRVRSRPEILKTVDRRGANRGLLLTADMLRYCDKSFRVTARVNRIIDESSGRLKHLQNECYILGGVTCSGGRSMCTREELYFWRDIWLEKLEDISERFWSQKLQREQTRIGSLDVSGHRAA